MDKQSRFKKLKLRAKYYDMRREKPGAFTRARRDPVTGHFTGRYSNVPAFAADNGKYLVLNRNLDINHDRKPDLYKGQIIARVKRQIKQKPRYVVIRVNMNKIKYHGGQK